MSSASSLPEIGPALGRIPSGLYILTVTREERSTGMLASWVQQAGFEPPMLTVAVRRDRYVSDWIEEAGRFVLNQVPEGEKTLLRHFGKGFDPDEEAFSAIGLRDEPGSAPILSVAMSYLDLAVVDSLEGGDHRIYLAQIVGGALFAPEERPMVHIRKSGMHY